MTDYYVDPSASVDGAGTEASPYNTFASLPADLSNHTVLIKRGTQIREAIARTANTDFVIKPYGTGAQPIINGADINAAWTDIGNNQYTITSAAIHGVWVNNVEMVAVATVGALTDNTLDHTGTTITIQTTTNPNSVTTDVTAREPIKLTNCTGVEIIDIEVRRSDNSGIKFLGSAAPNNNKVLYCTLNENGSWGSGNMAGLSMVQGASAAIGTGVVVKGVSSNRNINNLMELQYVNGATVSDCSGDLNGMGFEIWGYVQNSTLTRLRATNSRARGTFGAFGAGLWLTNAAQGTDTGNHSGNTFSYVDVIGCSQYALSLDAGTNNNFYNCTFISDEDTNQFPGSHIKEPGTETDANTFTNCIFYKDAPNSTQTVVKFAPNTNTTVLKNWYHHTNGAVAHRVQWEDSTYYTTSTIATYQTNSGETGDFADPLFTNDSSGSSLQTGSPCIGAGNSLSLTHDVDGVRVGATLIDVGARQTRLVPVFAGSISSE